MLFPSTCLYSLFIFFSFLSCYVVFSFLSFPFRFFFFFYVGFAFSSVPLDFLLSNFLIFFFPFYRVYSFSSGASPFRIDFLFHDHSLPMHVPLYSLNYVALLIMASFLLSDLLLVFSHRQTPTFFLVFTLVVFSFTCFSC